jgi:hypothetical protein
MAGRLERQSKWWSLSSSTSQILGGAVIEATDRASSNFADVFQKKNLLVCQSAKVVTAPP